MIRQLYVSNLVILLSRTQFSFGILQHSTCVAPCMPILCMLQGTAQRQCLHETAVIPNRYCMNA